MVCSSQSFFGLREVNKVFENWNGDVRFTAEQFWEPAHDPTSAHSGLGHLVFAVAQASSEGKRVTTVGSGWAFENLVQPDNWLISTRQLQKQIDYVLGTNGSGSSAVSGDWRRELDDVAGRRLVHVEAGITVGLLNELLNAIPGEPLAMPIVGGANGQSLLGAISTSTHGGDWQQPPLPDLVRAIHLVTEGGQEVWIERATDPVTTDGGLRTVLPCGDTRIVRDDDVFNSAVVSLGRFGVIYAVILEVRRAFNVAEVVTLVPRTGVVAAFRSGVRSPRPIDPLLAFLAATPFPPTLKVSAEAVGDPYFCQVVFNSQDPSRCWATRRWETTDADVLHVPAPSTLPILAALAILELNVAWTLGLDVTATTNFAFDSQMSDGITEGRRGPHYVTTSGTKEQSLSIPYKSDSIEVIFAADDDNFVRFLEAVLVDCKSYKQAGYVSVRPSQASRATMSMHGLQSPLVYSVEVSTLKDVPQAKVWMNVVHTHAMAFGGRPHWGQYNKLDQPRVSKLYGMSLHRWHRSLWHVIRRSDRFSSDFTRRRGLDPENIRVVRSVFRTPEGIPTHFAGELDEGWSPVSVRDVMTDINIGRAIYAVESNDGLAFIIVVDNPKVGGFYLRTESNDTVADNLGNLPSNAGTPPATQDEAGFKWLLCPHNIPTGGTATATVRMTNLGTSVWLPGEVLLGPAARSGVHFAPVALAQTTTPLQWVDFSFVIQGGAVGTSIKLSCQLTRGGLPFGERTPPHSIVFTSVNEPLECVDIREEIAKHEEQIVLLKDQQGGGTPQQEAEIVRQIMRHNAAIQRLRAQGAQLGCTLA